MALLDYFRGAQHKRKATQLDAELKALQIKFSQLEATAKELSLLDFIEVKKRTEVEGVRLKELVEKISAEEENLNAVHTRLRELQQQVLVAEDTIELETFALYEPKYQLINSSEYKERLDELREAQKATVRDISATVDSWDNYAVEITKAKLKKLRKDLLKLALRAFNSESEYCIEKVKFSNVEKMEMRIRRSFEMSNKLLAGAGIWWTEVVLREKLEELHLAHEYQVKRQEEKDAAQQARADQREGEKLQKEIREARAKVEKERRHFTAALQKLELRLSGEKSPEERESLQARIHEISEQNSKLDEQEQLLDYREQNARAGYVYVISNIGAFGEGVFKIGMTRRLEPMERVDELGDASVPFRFDVHALVFSDDAPALEAKLHARFSSGRLNKVNGRKEFFYADLKEIEQVIRANYDAVVEVVHTAHAEQYRESLVLGKTTAQVTENLQ